MHTIGTTIRYDGVKLTKSFQRIIQKQIERWIERETKYYVPTNETSYEIKIEREPGQPFTFCHLKVQLGSKIWESHDTGKTIQDALQHAMKHLRPGWVTPSTVSSMALA